MPSYNRVILIGRLTREPELKYTAAGFAVVQFSIAVDRKFKNQQGERQTDFFRCKAWRQKAEFVANYVTKGRLVAVDGSIETSEVTGQDGQKRYFTDIVCENVENLESQRDTEGGGETQNATSQNAVAQNAVAQGNPRPQEAQRARPQTGNQTGPQSQRGNQSAAYPPDDFDDADPFADG